MNNCIFLKEPSIELENKFKEVYPDIEIITTKSKAYTDFIESGEELDSSAFWPCSDKDEDKQEFFLIEISGHYFPYNNTRYDLFEYNDIRYEEKIKGDFKLHQENVNEDVLDEFLDLIYASYNLLVKKDQSPDNDKVSFYEDESLWEGGDLLHNIALDGEVFEIKDKELIDLFEKNGYVYNIYSDLEGFIDQVPEEYQERLGEYDNKILTLESIKYFCEVVKEFSEL
ncbi:MAG: hypothetical protein ACRCX2_01785 [Paraclostridium sp.]